MQPADANALARAAAPGARAVTALSTPAALAARGRASRTAARPRASTRSSPPPCRRPAPRMRKVTSSGRPRRIRERLIGQEKSCSQGPLIAGICLHGPGFSQVRTAADATEDIRGCPHRRSVPPSPRADDRFAPRAAEPPDDDDVLTQACRGDRMRVAADRDDRGGQAKRSAGRERLRRGERRYHRAGEERRTSDRREARR